MTIRLDGKKMSGDYLMLEVQNIRYIGPNLELHPEADINDGFLDVVMVGAKERNKLKPYLMKTKPKRGSLTVRRARHEISIVKYTQIIVEVQTDGET